jgi:hypothetical protein
VAKVVATKPRAANGGITAPKSAAPKTPAGPYKPGPTVIAPGLQQRRASQPSAAFRQAAANITNTNWTDVKAAAPPTPPVSAPWDGAEQLSDAGADAKYNNALLNAGYKKTAYQQEYGLDPGFNDYKANPYSRAALLEQTFQRANRASGNSLAAGGQLYSGASQNAETYNREHKGQETNALEGAYRKALQGVNEEEAGALTAREEEKANAKWKAIEAASAAELEPGTAPGGGGSKSNPYAEQAGGVLKKITNKKTGKKTVVGISGAKKAR